MPVSLLIPLIVQVGLPLAQQLIGLWEKGGDVTAAQFAALTAAASVSARDVLKKQLADAGISLDSPQALALLSQVPA